MASGPAQGPSSWRKAVQALYPDLTSRAYYVPPVYFNRVKYTQDAVAGQHVLVVQPPDNSVNPDAPLANDVNLKLLMATVGFDAQFIKSILTSSEASTTQKSRQVSPNRHSIALDHSNNNDQKSLAPEQNGQINNKDQEFMAPEQSGQIDSNDQESLAPEQSGQINSSDQVSLAPEQSGQINSNDQESLAPEESGHINSNDLESLAPEQNGQINSNNQESLAPEQSGQINSNDQESLAPEQSGQINSNDQESLAPEQSGQINSNDQESLAPEQGGQINSNDQGSSNSTYSMWIKGVRTNESLQNVQETDTRDDFAQQHVMFNLQAIGDHHKEVMFVISQLDYQHYLNKAPNLNPLTQAVVDTVKPLLPAATGVVNSTGASEHKGVKLPKLSQTLDGDFDILLIHLRYGILIGEVKSVGIQQARQGSQAMDADVAKKVSKAISQLERSENVVKMIVKDVQPNLLVRKVMMVPYVTTQQLQRVLAGNQQMEQKLRHCLGVPQGMGAEQLCLCADQMSDCARPWDVTSATMSRLAAWWNMRMASEIDSSMSADVYLEVVSRLAGPATTVTVHCVVPPRVEVRTEGEAVSEVGERMARIVLTPKQVDLVSSTQPMVCLTGPPGTGKTLMLVLKGLDWLHQGHDVHVLSIGTNEYAVSRLIHHQLLRTEPTLASHVFFHHFCLDLAEDHVNTAVSTLAGKAKDGELYVIIDEATFSYDRLCRRVTTLINKLKNDCKLTLHVWAASLFHLSVPPILCPEGLTEPLRCPPVVQREVEIGVNSAAHLGFLGYTRSGVAPPADGPSIHRLRHQGQGHSGVWPAECAACGEEMARILNALNVGVTAQTATNTSSHSPPPLQFRDVFVVTMSKELGEDCGFVRGLRAARVPVVVLDRRCADQETLRQKLADVAVANSDCVTVAADFDIIKGLERKVVVLLPGLPEPSKNYTAAFYMYQPDLFNRVRIMSRCMSKLIVVEIPKVGRLRKVHDVELD